MALFIERGYDDVTVADIASRAGLTKRTFFNHFADKREVIFGQSDEFEARIIDALATADPELSPLEATVWAYGHGIAMIADYPELVRARGRLVASSRELQERDLMKMASLTAKAAGVLVQRGAPERQALFAAQAGASIFIAAVAAWAAEPERGIEPALQDALAELQAAVV
ncbi:MAG: TetR/AcrR family transcriptional regulator [Conexibacteraceae bacterium]|nr:TetR/AcrR family transcriptional regulator [Conexibacteraceae bacterium]